MQVTVTLASYKPIQKTNSRGPYTIHVFTDSSGQDYTTFDAAIASQLLPKVGNGQTASFIYKSLGQSQWGEKRSIEHVVPDGAPAQNLPAQTAPPQPLGVDPKDTKIAWAHAANVAAALLAPLVAAGEQVGLRALHRAQWDIYQHMQAGPRPPVDTQAQVDEGIPFGDPQPTGFPAGY